LYRWRLMFSESHGSERSRARGGKFVGGKKTLRHAKPSKSQHTKKLSTAMPSTSPSLPKTVASPTLTMIKPAQSPASKLSVSSASSPTGMRTDRRENRRGAREQRLRNLQGLMDKKFDDNFGGSPAMNYSQRQKPSRAKV
jgi:hypothetical protein